MSKKKATKRPVVPAPQDLNEAADFVRKIGEAERAIETANSVMNEQLEQVKQPFVEQVEQHRQQLDQLLEGLYAYAEGHRAELTGNDKKKTVTLPTGSFCWRMTPKEVNISGVKAVLVRLGELNLKHFIRTTESIDKKAMLKEEMLAVSVDGVAIGQREEFVVKPAETKAEVTVTPGKDALKLALSSGPGGKLAKKKSA